jgi:arginine/serine-rich splicing factor 4/5/6/transcription factor SPN1
MPKECVIAWITALKDGREETTITEELIQAGKKERKRKEKKRERKKRKEPKRKERNAELRRRTKAREIAYYDNEAEYYHTTSRNADASKNNTTTSNALTTTRATSRKCLTISASDCTRGANQPGQQGTADGRRKCSYEGSKRKNKRRRPKSSSTRRSKSKSKRSRTTRRGRRSRNLIILLNGSANG